MTDRRELALRHRAREAFFEADGQVLVRTDIEESWRRSHMSGVAPDRPPSVSITDFDHDSRLIRAASPVLDRLADTIADSSMSLMLCDSSARILERRVGVRNLENHLDRVAAIPGVAFNEEFVGTNGLGTTLELRRPFMVEGGEHFSDNLKELTCAGAPIVHPLTGRLEGVLDITCRSSDGSKLMLSFIMEAAAEIRRRLYEAASFAERALMEHFLATIRRSNAPVVSVSSEFILANASAARLLEPADHAILWERASSATNGESAAREVVLAGGQTYMADVRPIMHAGDPVGAIVQLGKMPVRRRHDTVASRAIVGLVGSTHAWAALCDDVREAAKERSNVALIGEAGAGKLAIARALHTWSDDTTPLLVLDAAMLRTGEPAWFETLSDALRGQGTVVVRHLELLSVPQASTLSAVCESSTARLLATADDEWMSTAPRRLVDCFPARIVVPPLRQRSDDVPVLLAELIRRRGVDAKELRVRSDVVQLLTRHPWPGNVREFDGVVSQILAKRTRGDVTVTDLPVEYRSPRGDCYLTPMQKLERDAIIRALDEEQGNKNAAAERLGISRSTLYRKLDAYHVGLRELMF